MHTLADVQLFSKLSEKYLAEIQQNAIIRSYTKDSIVFYEGDSSDYLHIVLDGVVKLYKTTPKGTQIQIHRIHAPSLVAEYACFESQAFPATCEFVTEGKIALVHFDFIHKHLEDKQFSLELIKALTSKIIVLSTLVHKETILSSEAKVAKMLLDNISIFGRLKYNEIAAILNITPETLSRIFKKLKKEQVIEMSTGHQIKVLNHEILADILEGNKIKECTDCIVKFKQSLGIETE